jgi:predicted acyl esterase
MPDGTELSARIWLPKDAAKSPVPAILEHLPYRKRDGTIVRDALTHPYLAGHGYACIRVDMRGNGDSQGLMHDEYSEQELQDAESVIAWLRQQSSSPPAIPAPKPAADKPAADKPAADAAKPADGAKPAAEAPKTAG